MSIVTIDVNSELFTVPYHNAIKSEYIKELLHGKGRMQLLLYQKSITTLLIITSSSFNNIR